MSRCARIIAMSVVLVGAGPGRPADARGSAEDDLSLVRRAVARVDDPSARPETSPAPRKEAARTEPRWLRVRIKEKAGRSTVSVNLPLALARVLDEIPLDGACRRHDRVQERRKMRLGDLLASLAAGQDIVQVDSEDGSVRVWVD